MTSAAAIDAAVAQTEGLPRRNGELTFDAPWQARAFGLAVALSRERGLDWDVFRSLLIEEIGRWEREHAGDESAGWSYYARWLDSLERLVLETGMVSPPELEDRHAEIAHELEHDHHDHHDHHD